MKNKNNFLKLIMIFMALAAFVAFSATPALCDTNAAAEDEEMTGDIEKALPEYGPTNFVSYSQPPLEFVGYNAAADNMIQGSGMNRYCTSTCTLNAGVHLPTGAKIIGWELDYYDGGAGSVGLNVMYCPYNAGGCTPLAAKTYSSTSGYGWVQKWGLSHRVNNYNNSYLSEVSLPGTSTYRLVGGHVFYMIEMSPAPGSASFSDVFPWDWYFAGVEALARSGITVGCGGSSFCPNVPVTRAQMAVFLSRALGLHWPN